MVAFDGVEQRNCFQPDRKSNFYHDLYRYRDQFQQLRELQYCNHYGEPTTRCQCRLYRNDMRWDIHRYRRNIR